MKMNHNLPQGMAKARWQSSHALLLLYRILDALQPADSCSGKQTIEYVNGMIDMPNMPLWHQGLAYLDLHGVPGGHHREVL